MHVRVHLRSLYSHIHLSSPIPKLTGTHPALDANDTVLWCYSTSAHTGPSPHMHLHVRPSVAAGCLCTVESKRWEIAASSPEGSGTHLSLQCRIPAAASASVSWGGEKQREKTYRRDYLSLTQTRAFYSMFIMQHFTFTVSELRAETKH